MPEASGSRVPAWPAFLALSRRLRADTARVEVMPTGLSSTIQPCTSTRLRRGAFMRSRVVVVVVPRGGVEIAAHLRRAEQRLDAGHLVQPVVEAEAHVRRELQVHLVGDLGA